MQKIYLLCLLLTALLNVNAADYYVNPSTGDNNNDGSEGSPWKSLEHAFSEMKPGDVLNLFGGTYQPFSGIPAGLPGEPITIKGVAGERALISNSGVNNGILITNDNIIIDGLEVGNVKNNCINIQSSYVTIRNCILHDSGLAIKTNTSSTNHHILIEYCSIYNFSDIPIFPDAVDKIIIRNNVMYNAKSVMMDPGGVQELLIENNFVTNPENKLGALKIRWGNVEDADGPNCNGAIVRNNIFLEGDKYNILLASSNGAMVYNNIMINNMLNGSMERGIVYMQKERTQVDGGGPLGPNLRNVIKNNIFQINGGDSYNYDHSVLVEARVDMAEDITTNEFDYNLYYKSSGTEYIVSGTDLILENGVVGWNGQFDWHSIVGEDPELNVKDTLESPRDFMPTENSPVIDKGAQLTVTVNSGSSNILQVEDSRYFYSGHGMISGDKIIVGNSDTAIVTDRDIYANTITLNKVVSWEEGDSVSLIYSGSAPDIGAYELGIENEIGNAAGAEELFKLINDDANPTDIIENVSGPSEFHLYNNYPNPFNPTTTIKYSLNKSAIVNVAVYDVLGSKVKDLINKEQAAGAYQVIWDGTNKHNAEVSGGIYFYKINSAGVSQAKKMILLK